MVHVHQDWPFQVPHVIRVQTGQKTHIKIEVKQFECSHALTVNSLVVLIWSCEVIGFHGVPAQCVAPHCHYHLQEGTADKSQGRLKDNNEVSAVTFLSGVDSLMSYSTILLSEAQLARSSVCGRENDNNYLFCQQVVKKVILAFLIGQGLSEYLTSTGLKWTELKLSTPQVKERIGLLLCSSQMSTCWPHVANKPSCRWWSKPVNTVWMGGQDTFDWVRMCFTLQRSHGLHFTRGIFHWDEPMPYYC